MTTGDWALIGSLFSFLVSLPGSSGMCGLSSSIREPESRAYIAVMEMFDGRGGPVAIQSSFLQPTTARPRLRCRVTPRSGAKASCGSVGIASFALINLSIT